MWVLCSASRTGRPFDLKRHNPTRLPNCGPRPCGPQKRPSLRFNFSAPCVSRRVALFEAEKAVAITVFSAIN